jgi:hypothetical protein
MILCVFLGDLVGPSQKAINIRARDPRHRSTEKRMIAI